MNIPTSAHAHTRALALNLLAGLALGLSALTVAPALAEEPATPTDALKGPEVPQRTTPAGQGSFGDKGPDARRGGELPIPHRAFMNMLRETLGPSAAEDLRLSDQQRGDVEKIDKEFSDSQRGFMEQHREELQGLVRQNPEVRQLLRENGFSPEGPGPRGQRPQRTDRTGAPRGDRPEGGRPEGDQPMDEMAPPPRGPGGPRGPEGRGGPEGRPEMDPKEREAIMARLQELRAQAPKAEDARTAIWALLKPEQQNAVQVKVDEFKKRRTQEMDERYKERTKRQLEGKNAKPGEAPAGARGPALTPEQRAEVLASLPAEAQAQINKLPERAQSRVLARLSQLPAAERPAALEEMRKRLEQGGAGGRGGGKGDKPADAPKSK